MKSERLVKAHTAACKSKAGRKPTKTKQLLREFRTNPRQSLRKPNELKKEYVRAQMIRGFKRAIRHALKNKSPQNCPHQLRDDNIAQWECFTRWVKRPAQAWLSLMESISDTISGPKTDARGRRKKQPATSNSFNDKYIHSFFKDPDVQHGYQLYVNVVYGVSLADPEDLCNAMEVQCCGFEGVRRQEGDTGEKQDSDEKTMEFTSDSETKNTTDAGKAMPCYPLTTHSESCCDKWLRLSRFCRTEMIDEVMKKYYDGNILADDSPEVGAESTETAHTDFQEFEVDMYFALPK